MCAIAAIVLSTAFFAPQRVKGIDCSPIDPQNAMQRNDVVFHGRIVKIPAHEENPRLPNWTQSGVPASIEVSRIWKGDITPNMVVRTQRGKVGEEYVFYGRLDGVGEIQLPYCSVKEAAWSERDGDFVALGPGREVHITTALPTDLPVFSTPSPSPVSIPKTDLNPPSSLHQVLFSPTALLNKLWEFILVLLAIQSSPA